MIINVLTGGKMAELTEEITVKIESKVFQALQNKSKETTRSLSELVNEALVIMYREDSEEIKKLSESDDEDFDDILGDIDDD